MHITPPLWQELVSPPIYESHVFSLGGKRMPRVEETWGRLWEIWRVSNFFQRKSWFLTNLLSVYWGLTWVVFRGSENYLPELPCISLSLLLYCDTGCELLQLGGSKGRSSSWIWLGGKPGGSWWFGKGIGIGAYSSWSWSIHPASSSVQIHYQVCGSNYIMHFFSLFHKLLLFWLFSETYMKCCTKCEEI